MFCLFRVDLIFIVIVIVIFIVIVDNAFVITIVKNTFAITTIIEYTFIIVIIVINLWTFTLLHFSTNCTRIIIYKTTTSLTYH